MIQRAYARRVADSVARHLRAGADQSAASARLELAQVLEAGAASTEHADEIAKWIKARMRTLPTANEAWSIVDAVRPPQKLRQPDPRCPQCKGGGWWYPDAARKAVAPCVCRRMATG